MIQYIFLFFLIAIISLVCTCLLYKDPVEYDDTKVSIEEILPYDSYHRVKFLCAADKNRDSWFRSSGKNSYFLNSSMDGIKSIQTGRTYHLRESNNHKHTVDARMFIFKDKKFIYFVDSEYQMSIVNEKSLSTQSIKLVYPGMHGCQKNWIPLVYGDQLYFITRLVPLHVVHCLDVTTGVCEVHHDADPSFEWDDKVCFIRGGTNTLPVSKQTPHLFVGFAHTTMNHNNNWTKLCNYRIMAYTFNFLTLQIELISSPINFWHSYTQKLKLSPKMFCRVHFPTVCYFDEQDLVIGVDFFDCSSALFRWKSSDFQKFLQQDAGVSIHEKRAEVARFSYPTMGGLSLVSSWFSWLRVKNKLT